MQIMNKNGFSRCGELYIGLLRKEGRFSTAHVYQNALFSFNKFCGNASVSFRQVTRDRLRLGREIWRGKQKNVENLDMSTVGRGIWQET